MPGRSAGGAMRLVTLLVLSVTAAVHATANYKLSTNTAARRRLLEAHMGQKKTQPVQVATKRSTSLQLQRNGTFLGDETEAIRDQDGTVLEGLRVAFYDRLDPTRTARERQFIMERLMPATATVLARSMRVRQPSGPLPLAGFRDETGAPIPGDPAGIDADIVMKVTSMPADSPTCEGLLAGATAFLVEQETLRPIYGFVLLCNVDESDFDNSLTTTVHEVLHALAMDPDMFNNYPGYENGINDVIQVFDDSRTILRTPNVVQSVQRHFNCSRMLGAELEDDGGRGSRGSHWEQRVFEGELMDAVGGRGDSHHFRHVMTDLTLGLIQDSGWYDVKYGSQGFNLFGYQGGCEFALGTYEQALSSPKSARYLCPADAELKFECLHDYSGTGVCFSSDLWDGFARSLPVSSSNIDCMARDQPPGQRCINLNGAALQCVPMTCSPSGDLLVDGASCDPNVMKCPDSAFMCQDPGLLTCLGDLNDCSARGDCLKGRCYCHTGWGGADCSVPACLAEVGCPDGSPCPGSGFCGVPECGTWSSGQLDRGIPCNGAIGAAPAPQEAPAPDLGPAEVADDTVPINFEPPSNSTAEDDVTSAPLPGDVVDSPPTTRSTSRPSGSGGSSPDSPGGGFDVDFNSAAPRSLGMATGSAAATLLAAVGLVAVQHW